MAENNEDDFDDEDDGEEGEETLVVETLKSSWRTWLSGRTGWIVIIIIALLQALFASIVILLKNKEKPVTSGGKTALQALAVEMLGYEVAVAGINQLISGPGGKRISIGVDLVLVLGQLPEEQIEGAPGPAKAIFWRSWTLSKRWNREYAAG